MESNILIQKISGDSKELFPLVGPLVMNAEVLKANNGYPFKTSHRHLWYVAKDEQTKEVVGFMPMEIRKTYGLINNYYVKEDNEEVMLTLLRALDPAQNYEAAVLLRHYRIFEKAGFKQRLSMVKYVKMELIQHELDKEERKSKQARDRANEKRKVQKASK
jgi:hypothetical protein